MISDDVDNDGEISLIKTVAITMVMVHDGMTIMRIRLMAMVTNHCDDQGLGYSPQFYTP